MSDGKVIGTTQFLLNGLEESNMNLQHHYREWASNNRPHDGETRSEYNSRMRCAVFCSRAPVRNFIHMACNNNEEEFDIISRCIVEMLEQESIETHVRSSRNAKQELGPPWSTLPATTTAAKTDSPLLEWEKYRGGHDHPESEPRAFQQITHAIPVGWGQQFELGPYRFDMIHEASKTLIELDSFEHHLNKVAFVKDRQKMRYGQVRGYVVMPIAFTELRGGGRWKSDLQWAVQR